MRHLLSLIAGVVVAPLAWALLAMGQGGTADTVAAWTKDNAFNTGDLIVPAAYLAGAGILLGLIGTLRISPVGAFVATLGYLGLNVGLFIDPFAVRDAVPNNWKIGGEAIPLRTPLLNGTLLAAGALLLIAVFSAKRWRQWPVAVPAGEAVAEPSAEAEAVTEPVGYPPAEQTRVAASAPSAQPPPDTTPEPPAQTPSEQPVAQPASASTPPPPAPGVAWPPPAQSGAPPQETATGPAGPPPPRHAIDDEIPPSPPPGDTPGSPWSAPPRPPE